MISATWVKIWKFHWLYINFSAYDKIYWCSHSVDRCICISSYSTRKTIFFTPSGPEVVIFILLFIHLRMYLFLDMGYFWQLSNSWIFDFSESHSGKMQKCNSTRKNIFFTPAGPEVIIFIGDSESLLSSLIWPRWEFLGNFWHFLGWQIGH